MSIYLVTWKTAPVGGRSTEGSFISECNLEDFESAVEQKESWEEHVRVTMPNRQGGRVYITGAFKL